MTKSVASMQYLRHFKALVIDSSRGVRTTAVVPSQSIEQRQDLSAANTTEYCQRVLYTETWHTYSSFVIVSQCTHIYRVPMYIIVKCALHSNRIQENATTTSRWCVVSTLQDWWVERVTNVGNVSHYYGNQFHYLSAVAMVMKTVTTYVSTHVQLPIREYVDLLQHSVHHLWWVLWEM